ncbi:unnamed protein product [Leuciscus chuanchicus]
MPINTLVAYSLLNKESNFKKLLIRMTRQVLLSTALLLWHCSQSHMPEGGKLNKHDLFPVATKERFYFQELPVVIHIDHEILTAAAARNPIAEDGTVQGYVETLFLVLTHPFIPCQL